MTYATLTSPWGNLVAAFDAQGAINGLWFEGQKYFPVISQDAHWIEVTRHKETDEAAVITLHRLEEQLEAYAEGTLKDFDLPLAPKGTPFQELVWQILLEIPFGQTVTYGEVSARVAKAMGKPSMSAQAVGGAIGHNPISIIVPCHRVIGTNGSLTGYAGGVDKKSALLTHETTVLFNNF